MNEITRYNERATSRVALGLSRRTFFSSVFAMPNAGHAWPPSSEQVSYGHRALGKSVYGWPPIGAVFQPVATPKEATAAPSSSHGSASATGRAAYDAHDVNGGVDAETAARVLSLARNAMSARPTPTLPASSNEAISGVREAWITLHAWEEGC